MVAFGGVVVDHVEPHLDARRVERLHHRPEFFERVAVRVRLMGREEVQRHVAPVVALLRIELVDREQLHNRDAEFLEVGNLLRQAGKRAAPVGCDARVRARGESLDVQFVDDGVTAGVSRARRGWNGHGPLLRQAAERRTSIGRTRLRAGVAAERGWKEHRRRVRIEQDLLRIEAVPALRLVRPFDPVGVERGAAKFARRYAAVPDIPGLVRRMLKTKFENRPRRVFLRVAQQHDAGGVPRVEREIEGVFSLHPLNPERPGTSRAHRAG